MNHPLVNLLLIIYLPTSFPDSSNLKEPVGGMIRPDASRPSGWCGDVADEVAWGFLVQGLGPPTNGSNATAFPSLPSSSSSSSSSCPSIAQIPDPSKNHFSHGHLHHHLPTLTLALSSVSYWNGFTPHVLYGLESSFTFTCRRCCRGRVWGEMAT